MLQSLQDASILFSREIKNIIAKNKLGFESKRFLSYKLRKKSIKNNKDVKEEKEEKEGALR